jgi:uncharacterized membrane protein
VVSLFVGNALVGWFGSLLAQGTSLWLVGSLVHKVKQAAKVYWSFLEASIFLMNIN